MRRRTECQQEERRGKERSILLISGVQKGYSMLQRLYATLVASTALNRLKLTFELSLQIDTL